MLQSLDGVLSLGIPPGALETSAEYCVEQRDAPLPSYGPAYWVSPTAELAIPASVSYRHALPRDTSQINIGHITPDAWQQSKGVWVSLGDCRVEPESRQVRCTDGHISPFYTLLDGRMGNVSDGGETTGDTGSVPTTGVSVGDTDPTSAGETGPVTPPIDYPPECDNLFRGPFTPVHVGPIFMPNVSPTGGAEDLAPDGQGGFVGRSGQQLVRLDVTQGTLGTPEDPNFTVTPLANVDLFTDTDTLGIRYLTNGDLAMMQRAGNRIDALHPDGSVTTWLTDLNLPNGLYADTQGNIWYSEYLGNGRISRYNPATDMAEQITALNEANGLLHDPRRNMLFYVSYTPSEVWRLPITPNGAPGTPAMVANLEGFSDGVAMDVCGNLYVVDQGNAAGESRLDRVFMTDAGELIEVEEVARFPVELANANFGFGEAYGDFQTAVFLSGLPGDIYYVDMQITGAPVPVLSAPPSTGVVALPYTEDFTGADGAPWPSPWTVVGPHITSATIQDNRGQMSATTNTGRVILPNFEETDVDVYVTVTFDDFLSQGFGFYARQNGGALTDTDPPGQGYGVYLQGGQTVNGDLGVWREIDGVEERLAGVANPVPGGIAMDTPYRVRFQCQQMGDQTRLRAKIWPASGAEPGAWAVDHADGTPELQNVAAAFSADVYNYEGEANVYIDDVSITAL